MRLIVRHILPIGLTTLALVSLWVIVTIPLAAVSLIDGEFVFSGYALFLIYAFSTSLGLTVVILFPVAALGEVLFKRTKHVVWALPLGLGVISVGSFVGYAKVYASFLAAVGSWSGFILLMSGLFVLYWTLLWLEKAAPLGGNKLFVVFVSGKRANQCLEADQLPLQLVE